ncbi:MAG: C10 family peptidase [bacterium]|nr:C10 family peptidase [bacterium]
MKKSILLLFIAAMAMGAIAGSVSSEMAIAAANAWVAKNMAFGTGAQATGKVLTERDPGDADIVLWHQVSMQGGGMLVVAPVTEIEPVVMALEKDPGELPAAHPLRGILTGDMRRRLQFLGLYRAAPSGGASLQSVVPAAPVSEEAREWGEASNAKWARLTGASLLAAEVGLTNVAVEVSVVPGFEQGGPLTHWNQGSYAGKPLYNLYTPNNAVCGCVATACAALAQFFGAKEAAEVTNPCSYNEVVADYTTKPGEIDWSILPKSFGGEAEDDDGGLTDEQRDLIGRVAYNAGVGVRYKYDSESQHIDIAMMWGDDESSAYEPGIVSALKDVFGFKNARYVNIADSRRPTQVELERLVYNQCRAGAPVGLSIKGHSVVAVGYGIDNEGVERVRVFMGWAGSGDGWYALPKIDTKATMTGGTYLSEVVDGVVTMISLEDDDIVPIVGHVMKSGAELSIESLGRTFTADDNGYFGIRVGADAGTLVVSCEGKNKPLKIGTMPKETDTSSSSLCTALPGAFEFFLLNCSVATTLEEANVIALREGKAILYVSGLLSASNTVAVNDHVYELDQDEDFGRRFVYFYTSPASDEGDGSELFYGVCQPEIANLGDDPNKLAFGFVSKRSWETNNTHSANHEVGEGIIEQILVTTHAPSEADAAVVTNEVDAVEEIKAAILESFDRVVAEGGRRFVERTSGIKVTIGATSTMAEKAIDLVADVANTCGLHENCYTNGPYTFVCDAEVTNAAQTVVLGCSGWTAINETTGEELSGTGTEAELTFQTNEVFTLTWEFAKTNAVYITVEFRDEVKTIDPEAVTPVSGWYPCGVPVQFQAKGEVGNYGFDYFKDANIPDGTIWLSETSVLVPVLQPGTVEVRYVKGKNGPEDPEPVTETCAVTVKNYVWDVATGVVAPADDQVPVTRVYSSEDPVEIADGETVDVPATMVYFTPSAIQYTTEDGVKMEYYGVLVGDDILVGEPLPVEEELGDAEAATVMWVWKSVKDGDDPDEPPTDFKIEWDDALTVLNAQGFSTNLLTKAQVEKYGIKIEEITVTAPKGFVAKLAFGADGGVVATLDLDEEVLQPVGLDGAASPLTILSNGDGTVTVKADVANGVRGFWYSLYAADELGGAWTVVATGYKSGTPSLQAQVDDATVTVSIDVEPTDAKKFYKLVVTDVKP